MQSNIYPQLGFDKESTGMPKKIARIRTAGATAQAAANNIARLMEARYAGCPNKPAALAQDAGVSLSTVQRCTDGRHSTSVDVLEAIAWALGVQPFELLIEHDALPAPQRRSRERKK